MRKKPLTVQSVVLAMAVVVGIAAKSDAHPFLCKTYSAATTDMIQSPPD